MSVRKAPRSAAPRSAALRSTDAPRSRWYVARGWIAGGVVAALIVTIAAVAHGFDAREVLRKEPSVWVTRDAGQYARVNTETGEIDTVRKVSEPSGVLQAGAESVVLTNGNGRAWPVNSALPLDLVPFTAEKATEQPQDALPPAPNEGADELAGAAGEPVRMPDGTRDIVVSGNYLLLLTETGSVFLGSLGSPLQNSAATSPSQVAASLQSLQRIDPLAAGATAPNSSTVVSGSGVSDGESGGATIDAIAISEGGVAALYSASAGAVWRFDAKTGSFVGGATELSRDAVGLTGAQLAIIAGEWALFDAESGTLWRQSGSVNAAQFAGSPRLQASGRGEGAGGTDALIADVSGLWRVPQQGDAERIVEAEGLPAQPTSVEGERFAAWIGQNSGSFWSSSEGERALQFDDAAFDLGEATPVFYTNGERAVLGETRTGMLWTMPEGRLIPLSQWTISDPPKQDQGVVVVDEVTEQVPPTAMPDRFGVREGEPAPLSVMLNDFDANKRDVLTIVPESLGENPLPESFGTIELAADAQSLMVRPKPGAVGTAAFSYRLSDGALTSNAATVTLNVVDGGMNSAPEWCPVEGCQRSWSVPEIVPGGTLVFPVLEGWIDPEGDPIMLSNVELLRPEDPATALVTAEGRLAVRHTDENAGAGEIMLRVTVRDARGAEQHRDLQVSVKLGASAVFESIATTVQVGQMTVVDPLERVGGGSGAFLLTDVSVQSGAERVKVLPRTSSGSIEVTASAVGEAQISIGIRDIVTGSEMTGMVRVTAIAGAAPLTLPPLRAFVRPLSDTSVEILDAIPGVGARAVSVQSAAIVDGDLRADVVEHARVRVAGSTPDGGPGRIGSVDVTVSEGATQTVGRLTVFQVAETGTNRVIAVADSAVVRAGAVVDVRVLDNDVASPGERLILHPEIVGSGAEGELAFASGGTLRYLAPKQPGTYQLSYTTYGASSPETGDVGSVTITVLPTEGNQDPLPATVNIRVSPGEQHEVKIPLSGVDPDGDRVRLIGVAQLDDAQLTASVAASGDAIVVSASAQAAPGVRVATYEVRDGEGASGFGALRVIVSPPNADAGAPVASSDYVRLVRGGTEPVVVRPLDNDVDPARGNLDLVAVDPNVPGGVTSSEYQKLLDRLDTSQIRHGIISIAPGDEIGTVSYRYTVKSSASSSSADGLLLVQTSERVGSQAPTVTDTVLNVRDRADLEQKGVDVVTDRVRWAAGDASTLKLSLWSGNSGGYRVSENRITGKYNPDGDLVAFQLSGVDALGAAVESFGFLIIPPLDELRVALKPGAPAIRVKENSSVDVQLGSFIDVSAGDRVEMAQQRFSVSRSQAVCAAISADALRYTAGAEQPWVDTCLVSVRLVGQKNWTALPLPVMIEPREPVVQLGALTRTVSPGSSETINLRDMVDWQGGRAGEANSLRFTVTGGGTRFDVTPSGSDLTVAAHADAMTGSQETLTVSVDGAGESQAPLTLRIGEAPRDKPRGGSVNLQCTVGSSCAIDVIGVPGEYDPFEGKQGSGLKLDTVRGSSCTFGTVSKLNDRGITVAWEDNRGPGGRCTIGYTVRDAQNRVGEGIVELDALGVPRAPATIRWSDFGEDSVTFSVELGAAQSAHPAVSGVEIEGPGNPTCSAVGPASFRCVATGLQNGVKGTYSARAVNEVGSSGATEAVTAWAYLEPDAPEVSVEQIETPNNTDPHSGTVKISVEGASDVRSYELTAPGMATQTINNSSGTTPEIKVSEGMLTVTAVPLSIHEVPTIKPASPRGGAATGQIMVAGAPTITSVTFTRHDRASGIVTASGIIAKGPDGDIKPTLTYGATRTTLVGNGTVECTQPDPVFAVQNAFAKYQPIACAQTPYGKASLQGEPVSIGGDMPEPTGTTYRVDTEPTVSDDGTVTYVLGTPNPVEPSVSGAFIEYSTGSSFVLNPEKHNPVEARQCFEDEPESCSEWVTLTPETAPTTVTVTPTGECIVPGDAESMRTAVSVSSVANGAGFSVAYDETAEQLTITWNSSFQSLKPAQLHVAKCVPPPDLDPAPEPEPEPDPGTDSGPAPEPDQPPGPAPDPAPQAVP